MAKNTYLCLSASTTPGTSDGATSPAIHLQNHKQMSAIEQILQHNAAFVAAGEYDKYRAGKLPQRRVAVVACMDTRLTLLLPAALGVKDGDIKLVKNAGGLVTDPTDSAMRSLLVGIYELGVREIMIVAHSDCGACHLSGEEMCHLMQQRGISADTIAAFGNDNNLDVREWLEGFHHTAQAVARSVSLVRNHPLVPDDATVQGFIIDTATGALTPVT